MPSIGRALGGLIAHEVAHQFVSFTHDENDEKAYDYRYTTRSSYWFTSQLHWTAGTRQLLENKLGR